MKTDRAQRLIGKIGDQYVSLASDAVEAFSLEEERRKRGRGKLRLIAAAAAAVYIILTVSLIIGALTPPDDPVAPPDDGPGAQDRPEQPGEPDDPSQHEPEIHLPDAEFFMNYLQGYWAPTFTPDSATTSDIVSNDNSHYSIFHFQPDGRVYIIDVAPQSITGEIGKYSVFGKNIELWTQVQDGWKRSDMSVQVVENENNTSTLNITANGKNQPYACYHETDNHMVLSGGGSYVEYWNAFVEQVSTLSSPSVSFGLPDLDYFKQLPVQTFEETPKLFFSTISSATYKLYNADLALIGEGELQISYENLSTATQNIFPDEQGLYYLDVTMDSHKNLSLYPMHITHFYAAVQIGEEEVDEPVTPAPTGKPEMPAYNLVDELCAAWFYTYEDHSQSPIHFVFTPSYQFYMVDAETGESIQGEYTYGDEVHSQRRGRVTVWVKDDKGSWQEHPIQIEYEKGNYQKNSKLHVTDESGTLTYSRTTFDLPAFHIGNINNYTAIESQQIQLYFERIEVESLNYPYDSFEFTCPDIKIFKTMTPISLDSNGHTIYPTSYCDIAYYTIYRTDGTIYEQGECDFTHPSAAQGNIPTIPDGQVYYYHIRYYSDVMNGDGLDYMLHCYFAIQQDKKPPEPTITLPEPSLWVNHLSGYWSPDKNLPYHFNFQLDGRVYLMNTDTGKGLYGKYSYVDDKIELWFPQDDGVWKKSNIQIAVQRDENNRAKTTMAVTEGAKKSTYTRIDPNAIESLQVRVPNSDPYEAIGVYNFYIQSVNLLDQTINFELPKLTDLRKMEPVTFTGAPRLLLGLVDTVQYKIYDKNFRVVESGDYTIRGEKLCLDFPQEAGIYYLMVSCDLNQNFGDGYKSRKLCYYLAIDYQPVIEEYKPPILGDNRVSIPLLDCDSPLAHMTLDTQNALHGSGCASATFSKGSPIISPNVFKSPIDATGMDMLEFDLYVSDLSLLTGNFFPSTAAALEITSGGTCDYEELLFTWEDIVRYGLAGQELKQGWNHVIFPLSMAKENSASAEKFDISQIDFIRFYIIDTSKLGSDEYTVKLDNICLTGEQK